MTLLPCFTGVPLRPSTKNLVPSVRGTEFVCARRNLALLPPSQKRNQWSMGLFGLGFPELAVIAAVGIFIFGPSKIATMGKDLGGLAGGVKKATSEFREAMQESLNEADREIELKQLEKDSAPTLNMDASASTVENASEKSET